jgi:hypothetical protein
LMLFGVSDFMPGDSYPAYFNFVYLMAVTQYIIIQLFDIISARSRTPDISNQLHLNITAMGRVTWVRSCF